MDDRVERPRTQLLEQVGQLRWRMEEREDPAEAEAPARLDGEREQLSADLCRRPSHLVLGRAGGEVGETGGLDLSRRSAPVANVTSWPGGRQRPREGQQRAEDGPRAERS